MKHYFLIIIFTAFCSCNVPQEKESKCYPKDSLISNRYGIPKDSSVSYFPFRICKDSSIILSGIDKFGFENYSFFLSCFQEPLLYNYYLKKDIYRFLWTRSFSAYVVIIIEKDKNNIYLTTKTLDKHPKLGINYYGTPVRYVPPILDTANLSNSDLIEARKHNKYVEKLKKDTSDSKKVREFYPSIKAKIKMNKTISLTKREWNYFLKLLESNKYWEMKPLIYKAPVLDGADWLLEAHTRDKYWFVERCNPVDSLRQCCEYLIKLSEVKNEEIY